MELLTEVMLDDVAQFVVAGIKAQVANGNLNTGAVAPNRNENEEHVKRAARYVADKIIEKAKAEHGYGNCCPHCGS